MNTWSRCRPVSGRVVRLRASLAVGLLCLPLSSTVAQECEPQWSALSTGMSGAVLPWTFAITVFDDGQGDGPAIYAGGNFPLAGGVTVNRVGRWDGRQWSALAAATGPAGVSGGTGSSGASVIAMTVFDDGSGPALFVAGDFTSAGGQPASGIARWDGRAWSPVGSGAAQGVGGTVSALAIFDDGRGPALYAGGNFLSAGGVPARNIARWDGTSWNALESVGHAVDGVDGGVFALRAFDDGSGPALYAGGNMSSAGGVPVRNFARWDGTAWSKVASPSSPESDGVSGIVSSLAVFDDGRGAGPALYVGGFFLSAGGRSVNRVARWDGSQWSDLGGGIAGEVRSLAAVDTAAFASDSRGLYVGGNITSAGGVAVRNFARWDGARWSSVAGGLDNLPFALTPFEGRAGSGGLGGPALFAGGAFTRAGDLPSTNRIARLHLCPGDACRADLDGDGELTIFDFLAFQNLFDAGDLAADFDGDGQLTIFDFLAFQNAFDAGCP